MGGKLARILMVIGLAASTGGCLQPLYGDHSLTATGSATQVALSGVQVTPIPAVAGSSEARIAVEVQNDLIFGLTGGGSSSYPTHEIRIKIASTRLSVIVDATTSRADVENYGLNATYELYDLAAKKTVLKDQTFSRVSYDIPGQQQRFAQSRGLRDAENRAAQVIAENIRNRLASFFVAGT